MTCRREMNPTFRDRRRLPAARRDRADLVALIVGWRPRSSVIWAAQLSVRASVDDPMNDAHVNVLGTITCWSGPPRRDEKLVFASSVAVYGIPAALPVSADAGLQPAFSLRRVKVCGEIYLDTYRALHGLDYTTLTLAKRYGPLQRPTASRRGSAIFGDALLPRRPHFRLRRRGQTRTMSTWRTWRTRSPACGERGSGRRFNFGTGLRTTTWSCTRWWPPPRAPTCRHSRRFVR